MKLSRWLMTIVLLWNFEAFASGSATFKQQVSPGVFKNSDNSFTFFNPQISRGDQFFSISGLLSNAKATCLLLGLDEYLEDSLVIERNSSLERLVDLEIVVTTSGEKLETGKILDAEFSDFAVDKRYYIEWISCFNREEFKADLRSDKSTKNKDGSVTIKNPHLVWGGQSFQLSHKNTLETCQAFGFDNYLDLTVETGPINGVRDVIEINSTAPYYKKIAIGRSYPITSISCFNYAEYQSAPVAKELILNPDSSVTIVDPKLSYGKDEYEIEFFQTFATCKLFGFNQYLGNSSVTDGRILDSIILNEKYQGSLERINRTRLENKLFKVTCNNEGKLNQSIGAVNGKIYYHSSNMNEKQLKDLGLIGIKLN